MVQGTLDIDCTLALSVTLLQSPFLFVKNVCLLWVSAFGICAETDELFFASCRCSFGRNLNCLTVLCDMMKQSVARPDEDKNKLLATSRVTFVPLSWTSVAPGNDVVVLCAKAHASDTVQLPFDCDLLNAR